MVFIYLPLEFDSTISVDDYSIGSVYLLSEALEELRAELDIDEDDIDEDETDIDMDVIEEQLRYTWRQFLRAANTSIERQVPLHVIS